MTEEFVAEVLRLNDRFLEEVVEAFNVCPFARAARTRGELVRSVLLLHEPAALPVLEELDRLVAGRPEVVVAIVILPLLRLDPNAFERFVQEVRAAEQRRCRGSAEFAAAPFHPDFPIDERSPAQLVPFFRRSPDPAIQFVRLETLERIRGEHGTFYYDASSGTLEELLERLAQPSITDRITDENHALVRRIGPDRMAAIYDDIRRDRARSYARFGRE